MTSASSFVNAYVRIEWPAHETHGMVGHVFMTSQDGLCAVALADRSIWCLPEKLVQVRAVTTWVDI